MAGRVLISVALIVACVAALGALMRNADRSAVLAQEGAPSDAKSLTETPSAVRAERRLFDGAPPVIPHQNFQIDCQSCHDAKGKAVPPIGFAPPMPHKLTKGISEISHCKQCHVFKQTDDQFRSNSFMGLRQDLRRGKRLNEYAPPVMPHPLQLRESCASCHAGPAARNEILCKHPERTRCGQCHVSRRTNETFTRLQAAID